MGSVVWLWVTHALIALALVVGPSLLLADFEYEQMGIGVMLFLLLRG